MNFKAPNLRSLDALRGLLATYVLLGHSRWLLWCGHSTWVQQSHTAWGLLAGYASAALRYGHEAVMVFFALSGFFIHLRAAQKLTLGSDVSLDALAYFKRRAHRILPPYLLALGITIAFDFVGIHFFPMLYHAQTGDALLDLNFARKGYDAAAVVPALLALPSSLGRDFGSNGPLWSLGYEVLYYLLYPIWYRLRCMSPVLAFAGVPIACIALRALDTSIFPIPALTLYPIWIGGALLAELALIHGFNFGGRLTSGLIGAGGFILLQHCPISSLQTILATVAGAAIVAASYSLPGGISGQGWHRVLEALGIRSYTIYIMHFPMMTLGCAWLLANHGGRPSTGYAAIAGAMTSLMLCFGLFHLCERHFLQQRIRTEKARHEGTGAKGTTPYDKLKANLA